MVQRLHSRTARLDHGHHPRKSGVGLIRLVAPAVTPPVTYPIQTPPAWPADTRVGEGATMPAARRHVENTD